jgi:2',3'-cyclic-nucleotide 2'-phosphodiesterase/3'-nucleotidase
VLGKLEQAGNCRNPISALNISMKVNQTFSYILILALAFSLTHVDASAQTKTIEHAQVTILSTTDLHGNILPIDYYTNKPDQRGLAKVASIVRQTRKENPQMLLLDSGDTIQGTPLEYVHVKKNPAPPDPMMLSMNALKYDAMAVGNHEYNFGLKTLEKARSEASFPWLSANTYNKGTDTTHFQPYLVKVVNGVRVGVLGLTTPAIPNWENVENYAGLEFREPVAEARKWVAVLRGKERVDLVVIAMHIGIGEDLATGAIRPGEQPDENKALDIAKEVPGIDVILMGHTHREIPDVFVNGVLLAQANYWGLHVARVDVYLEKDNRVRSVPRWKVKARVARSIPVDEKTAVDEEIAKIAEPYDRETQAWLNQVIGESDADLNAEDAYFRDTAISDLVQRVQMEAGKADVSMVASFNTRARINKGPVTVRDIAGIYLYENTLVVIEANGKMLKDALEHSARFFRAYEQGKSPADLIDKDIPGYNFDIAEGVTYELDIRKPFGERIQNLRFRGQPLGPTQKLKLAINNYRANGGGRYTMYKDAPVVYRSSAEIRELIIDWVERNKRIPTEPTNNWRLVY